ncbi:MAG: hypothetical protein K2F74_06985, partial [Muribaculaceae bacterium]|nr:hypothetical protein [Muribaculaceae bacterium]
HAMTEVIARKRELDELDSRLASMRASYAAGARDLASEILTLERRRSALNSEIRRATNSVISAELRQ